MTTEQLQESFGDRSTCVQFSARRRAVAQHTSTGPDYSGEKILTADLDPGEIAEGKFDPDVVGHCARPEVFRLEVNETWRKWLRMR